MNDGDVGVDVLESFSTFGLYFKVEGRISEEALIQGQQ